MPLKPKDYMRELHRRPGRCAATSWKDACFCASEKRGARTRIVAGHVVNGRLLMRCALRIRMIRRDGAWCKNGSPGSQRLKSSCVRQFTDLSKLCLRVPSWGPYSIPIAKSFLGLCRETFLSEESKLRNCMNSRECC